VNLQSALRSGGLGRSHPWRTPSLGTGTLLAVMQGASPTNWFVHFC
jgi:hypothetical protein